MIKEEVRTDVYLRSPASLREFMKIHDYTVRSLALRVGVSHGTIGHLTAGKRSGYVQTDVAKKIAKVLDAPFNILFEVRSCIVSRECAA